MIRLSINLPAKRRLDIKMVKSRKASKEKPLLPNLGKVLRARSGSKLSRFFRHIFENERVKKLLGLNIALLSFVGTLTPLTSDFNSEVPDVINKPDSQILTTESGIRYPLETIRVSQSYKLYHPGIDFDGVTGDPVYPIMAGTVSDVQYSRSAYGNAVLIDHGNSVSSLYAHLSAVYVDIGQNITINDVLGAVGATGRSFGDHLHLEVLENGYQVNPFIYLP